MEKVENDRGIARYKTYYSESKLLLKLCRQCKAAGFKVMYALLLLYYALKDDHLPAKEKWLVAGALGYFILPFDSVPDPLPLLGFTDDLLALVFALRSISAYVTPQIRERSLSRLKDFFGDLSVEKLNRWFFK
jgi:uncharacterized membrane protein YkvA (DUF1232 family)